MLLYNNGQSKKKHTFPDGEHLVGHNKQYEHILVPASHDRLGTWMDVRITGVSKFHMMSEIVVEEDEKSEVEEAPITKSEENRFIHLVFFAIVPVILALLSYFLLI